MVNIINLIRKKEPIAIYFDSEEELLKTLKDLEDNTNLKWIDGDLPTNLGGLDIRHRKHICLDVYLSKYGIHAGDVRSYMLDIPSSKIIFKQFGKMEGV